MDNEREEYLSEQIITYIGNKRALLGFIGGELERVKKALGRDKLDILDAFSGSGVVSRFFKGHARRLFSNDLEDYCRTVNNCYLKNERDIDASELARALEFVKKSIQNKPVEDGFIYRLYAPHDDGDIKAGERAFFTTRNAKYIDSARTAIEQLDEPYKTLLLGPLLYGASVHSNTSGVFKGFYKNSKTGIGQFGGDGKNALPRITGDIEVKLPVLSAFDCEVTVLQEDANELYRMLPHVDLAYLDPPYNQHPYGSNYFMLNLINSYAEPADISGVSGIPRGWNKSRYNSKKAAKAAMLDLCEKIDASYLLISFNSEGFIPADEMTEMLSGIGEVTVGQTPYNTFRGSRNLAARNIHVKEYLFLVEKRG